ncbi:unnamed protein product [Meganyctiphanes norvegica]|uniref:Uncharacterized protein n=1 Tax=Meganyctiphanes norvegica TaxID=48144 RepID=A0AAV2R441_MEGNR
MSDNTITVSCLLHQGSYRSETMMSLTRDILEFCQLHFITLVPKHLSGNLNVFADQESRIGPIATEWSLDPSTFQWLSDLAGPFQVDLFATRDNAQLQEFVSPFPDPLAVGINAFSLHWNDWTSIFLFPPVKVLHRVVSFLCQYRGQGILVAPYFAPSGWFPSLLQRAPDPVPLPDPTPCRSSPGKAGCCTATPRSTSFTRGDYENGPHQVGIRHRDCGYALTCP